MDNTQQTQQTTQQGFTIQDQNPEQSAGKEAFTHAIKQHNIGNNQLKEEALKAINDDFRILTKLANRDPKNSELVISFIKAINNKKETPENKQKAIVNAVNLLFSDNLTEAQAGKFRECINESKKISLMRNNVPTMTECQTTSIPDHYLSRQWLKRYNTICEHTQYVQEEGCFDYHTIEVIQPLTMQHVPSQGILLTQPSTEWIQSISCKNLEQLKKNQPITNQQARNYGLNDKSVILITRHRVLEESTKCLFRICNLFRLKFYTENSFPEAVNYLSINLRVENNFKASRTLQLNRKPKDSKQNDISMTVTNKPVPLKNPENESQHNLDIIFLDVKALESFCDCFTTGYKNDDSYDSLKKNNKIKIVTTKSSCTTVEQETINDIVENVLKTSQNQLSYPDYKNLDHRIGELCPNQPPSRSQRPHSIAAFFNPQHNTLDCKDKDDTSYWTQYQIESQRLVMEDNKFKEGDIFNLNFI